MDAIRQIIVSALVLSLACGPTSARPAVLGIVVYAGGAHIGASDASQGTTVYDGDQLSTEDDGELRVNMRTARLQLAQQSSVTLRRIDQATEIEADLSSGTLVFSAARATAIEVLADEARIRPAADAPTIAHVRVVGP